MRGLQYSTEEVLEGPWLLEAKALKDLDSIILKHWGLLEARRNQFLDLAVEEETRKYENQIPIFSIYETDASEVYRRNHPVYSVSYLQYRVQYKKFTYFCENFESTLRVRELSDIAPEGFTIEFCSGDISGKIDLEKTTGLSIKISPPEISESQDLFLDLKNWGVKNLASFWQRIWGRVANFGFRPYIVVLGVSLLIIFLANLSKSNSDILRAQDVAQQLIDQGISSSNLPEAVELLLQMQVLGRATLIFPSWFRVVFLATIFLAVVLPCACPDKVDTKNVHNPVDLKEQEQDHG